MTFATLSIVDYVLMISVLLLSTIIGIIFGFKGSKKNSAREYLFGREKKKKKLRVWYNLFYLANGEMGVIPTALSLTVSFVSAISLLGMPSEIYMHGTMFMYQSKHWKEDYIYLQIIMMCL